MSRCPRFVLCFVLLALPSRIGWTADSWSIATIAGTGQPGFAGEGGLASEAETDDPFGVVRGPDNAIWFCEYGGMRVRRIDPSGRVETIVGNGETGYSGDGGPAINASLNKPHEIRFDKAGDLYFVDMGNHVIRKVDMQTGIISTVAGTGKPGYTGDGGPADLAQLRQPHSLQFNTEGDLFICDIGNHVIRKINMKTRVIETYAGTGKPGVTPDGAALVGTPLNGPRSIDFDEDGNLWLATREGNQVFRVNEETRRFEHVAGTGAKGVKGIDGPAKLAQLSGPKGIALDAQGNAWLADTESHRILVIEASTGKLCWVAGTGVPGDGPTGQARGCQLNRPHGIFVDRDGSILIGDSEAHRVRVIRHQVK